MRFKSFAAVQEYLSAHPEEVYFHFSVVLFSFFNAYVLEVFSHHLLSLIHFPHIVLYATVLPLKFHSFGYSIDAGIDDNN